MKIALCLYGLVGGKTGKDGKGGCLDYKVAWNHYKEHIIDKNDVDVFIHTWSTDFERELTDLYRPTKSVFERQIDFRGQINLNVRDIFIDRVRKYKTYLRNTLTKNKILYYSYADRAYRAYSRWYSNKRTIGLKREYEIANGFLYDWVIISRLDVAFFTDVIFDRYDSDFFYASHWNGAPDVNRGKLHADRENHNVGVGFLDLWFFSNSKMMDMFSTLYDHLKEYNISPHRASRQHVDTFTDKIRYVFYRWDDHELVRRKYLNATE